MTDVVADAVRVFVEPEGIVLEFGHGRETGSDVHIEPLRRVVIPPATFRRLGMALGETLGVTVETAAHPRPAVTGPPTASPATAPASPGPAPSPTKPPLEALLDPTRDLPSSSAQPSRAAQDANRLFRMVSTAGAPFVYERSFRMREGELLPNRYLLSVGRQSERGGTDRPLAAIFRQLDMPGEFLEAAERYLPLARCAHFGFEADADSHLLKVYLEVAARGDEIDAIEGARRPDADAVLEHIAYKWNPADQDEHAMGQYLHWPSIPAATIRERLAAIYERAESDESQQIASGVLDLAVARMPEEDIHYLEIEEPGNPRRSFSVNFYDADLFVTDLQPLLGRMRRHFGVSPSHFQTLYDQIKDRRFGHLAGGVHRNGKGFFNVYYGPQFFDEGQWRNVASRAGLGARPEPGA